MLRRALFPLLLSATTFTAAARAEPTATDVESARLLLRQGNELRAANDLRAALARYQDAHALVGTPITGYEVGRTHVQLGELVEGHEALVAVAKIPPKAKESVNTATARAEAESLAREVSGRIPTLRVTVKNARGVVRVSLDGKTVSAATALRLNPGKHIVAVEANGSSKSSEIIVSEKETREVEFAFDAVAVATPDTPAPSPVGPGAAAVVTTKVTPTWVWVGFGVAGAGAAVGAVAGVLTLNGTANLSDRCPGGDCPPSEHAQLARTERWATVSTISFVVAGAAATVSIIGLITAPSRRAVVGGVHPTVGIGTLGLEGSF